jgi:putative copper resistance protein D
LIGMDWLSYGSMFVWYASTIVLVGAAGACRVFSDVAVGDGSSTQWARASLRMARIMMPLMLLAVATRLCVQTWQSFGIDQPLLAFAGVIINETPWGAGWFWQMCACVAAWVVFGVMSPSRWPVLVAAAVATALTVGLTGHAAGATEYGAWLVGAHGVHVVATGLWLGTLGVMMSVTRRTGATAAESGALARAVGRFSPQAIPSVALLVVSGVVAGWQHVNDLDGLLTPYGFVLIAKVVAFGGAALCGFYNWRVVRPTLGTDQGAVRHLRGMAALELAFGIVALMLTSILTSMPMPDHE